MFEQVKFSKRFHGLAQAFNPFRYTLAHVVAYIPNHDHPRWGTTLLQPLDFGSRMMQVVTQIFPFITPAKFRGGHAQTPN